MRVANLHIVSSPGRCTTGYRSTRAERWGGVNCSPVSARLLEDVQVSCSQWFTAVLLFEQRTVDVGFHLWRHRVAGRAGHTCSQRAHLLVGAAVFFTYGRSTDSFGCWVFRLGKAKLFAGGSGPGWELATRAPVSGSRLTWRSWQQVGAPFCCCARHGACRHSSCDLRA